MIDEQRLDRILRHERGRSVAEDPPPDGSHGATDPGEASRSEPPPRWIVPLESFLGDEEPDDDDSAEWIIRDIVPRGEASLIAGPPKCGKTWSMLSLGIDVAIGKPWLDTFENTMGGPARVLLLAFEDSERRLRKRVWELARARGISPNDPTLREHLSISRIPLRLPDDARAFAAELKTWKPAFVLTDNLTRVMVGDQNAIKDAKRFCDTWSTLCSDVGASIGFLHHTSKVGPIAISERDSGDPFELIRGSGDFMATTRHAVLIRPMVSSDEDALADVRMRGNLDLRREDFVLSFARSQDPHTGRMVARLADRGDGDEVRGRLAADRKASKKANTEASKRAGLEHRRDVARGIARQSATSSCSSAQLGAALGMSDRAAAPTLVALEASGEMIRVKQLGYVLVRKEAEQGLIELETASGALHHGGI